jgi:signal transduction histidine kinase
MVTLESAELFRNLHSDELAALRQVALERHFDAGQEIFHEGDCGDGVYVVKEGSVEITGLLNQSTRRVFSQLGPGEVFGEMAVIEHRPRSASAKAVSDTTVYLIPRGEMLSLIERSPGLALSLLQEISHRLREFNRQYLNEVVQAERLAAVGRFARAIVHDLKNPLQIIGLTSEMAGMPDAPLELRAQARERIRRQVERISELVGEILDFTQGSQAAVVLEPTDYATYVQKVLEEMHQEIELKSVRLEFAVLPPAVKLRLDPKRLRRVFANLTHNATDAMPNGGKIVFRFSQNAKEVVTEIEDTGPGIAPEIADKLFEAFATHGKAHGTGLGLSICKKIVEDHGGRIWTRNEPGRGAIFAFALPVPR